VLVELPHPLIDLRGSELRPGQLIQRRDDADVGRVGEVAATEHLGQLSPPTPVTRERSGGGWTAMLELFAKAAANQD